MNDTATFYQYQLFPELAQDEYSALKDDIARRGVMVAVEKDDAGNILDGFHRVRICQELGIDNYPVVIRIGMTHEEKIEHALSLNLNRRHLTREQRDGIIWKLGSDGWSTRRIADKLKIGNATVHRVLATVPNETVELPERIIGYDGKERPAHVVRHVELPRYYPEPEEDYTLEEYPPTPAPMPHVAYNSGNNEWYTPSEYIEAARAVLDSIDLDPASSDVANRAVKADTYYTIDTDGLTQEWAGRVWMNPPYAGDLVGKFCAKLLTHIQAGSVTQAIVLVNNATETIWFQAMLSHCSAVCFPKSRVKFLTANGNTGAPLQGQAVLFFGPDAARFISTFRQFGEVCQCAA